MALRPISVPESKLIGVLIHDPFVAMGHPLTCNGGNPNLDTYHDHEVRMLMRDESRELVCPECGRVQPLPEEEPHEWSGVALRRGNNFWTAPHGTPIPGPDERPMHPWLLLLGEGD